MRDESGRILGNCTRAQLEIGNFSCKLTGSLKTYIHRGVDSHVAGKSDKESALLLHLPENCYIYNIQARDAGHITQC
jgi:hypothetical protein